MSLPVLHSHSRSHRPRGMAQRTTSRTSSEPKPLNFNQAMEDFHLMFPHLDNEVILTVLRANNGVVQSTIDQLLEISEDSEQSGSIYEDITLGSVPDLPSYADHHDSFPNEPPPAYTELAGAARQSSPDSASQVDGAVTAASPNLAECRTNQPSHKSRFWKSGIVSTIADDFLRLSTTGSPTSTTSPTRPERSRPIPNSADGFETEQQFERYLEDERLAMFLQNEEFVRQLRHNPEFVSAVEADHRSYVANEDRSATYVNQDGAAAASGDTDSDAVDTAASDDAAFSLKLKHMGKSTRKRFGKIAKRFSKTKRSVRGVGRPTESTFNLLDEDEDVVHETAGIDGLQQETGSTENSYGSDDESSTTSPRSPAIRCIVNDEPIVFYGEDNEFELKHDGSEA